MVSSLLSGATLEFIDISRRILLFPFGNSNAPPNDTVSVYLDYAEPKKAPEGWHACAQFALVISNIHDPTIFTVSRTCSLSFIPHFAFSFLRHRCTTSIYRRGVWLGLHTVQRTAQAFSHTGKPFPSDYRRRCSGYNGLCPCLGRPHRCFMAQLRKVSLQHEIYENLLSFFHCYHLSKLWLEEGDWPCWIEESRRHMLHEFPAAISLLYALFPEGK